MIEELLEIRTPDGAADALLVRPDSRDALPGVINLTDGLGFRQAFADQSKRIAEHGYVVLTPNIFYRTSKPPVFDFEPDFATERTRQRFGELKAPLTPDAMASDGSTYVDFLAAQRLSRAVPMGVTGSVSLASSPFASPLPSDRIGAAHHSMAADFHRRHR